MQLNDLLRKERINPKDVIVFRHAPSHQPELRKDFLWLLENNHALFNAYQQTQEPRVEDAMKKAKFVGSFIGHEAGKALFAGLYKIDGYTPLSFRDYWKEKLNVELRKKYNVRGMSDRHGTTLWFDLVRLPFCEERIGKMVIRWPGKEHSWTRWAERNEFTILEDTTPVTLTDEQGAWDEVIGDPSYYPQEGDWRKVVDRQIRERRGQQRFRDALRKRYGDKCLITSCKVLAVLEAAHINPYRGETDNHPENGLLLRADIHTLFDLDLLGIEPNELCVELHPNLTKDLEYRNLAGQNLRCGTGQKPSREALRLRYRQFKKSFLCQV